MSPILISILLGLTAAAANVFGGSIIVQRNWERRYLRYFVALGAGFMLATALVEMVPESLELRGRSAAYLILLGNFSSIFSNIPVPRTFTLAKRRTTTSSCIPTRATPCCSVSSSTHSLTALPSRPVFWFRTLWAG